MDGAAILRETTEFRAELSNIVEKLTIERGRFSLRSWIHIFYTIYLGTTLRRKPDVPAQRNRNPCLQINMG